LALSIPYTVVTAEVNLPAYSKTFTIAASSTQDGEAGIIATLSCPAQTVAVGTGVIQATITIDDSNGNGDDTYNAKQLDIEDDIAGLLAASWSYATDDAGGVSTAKLMIIPGIKDRSFGVTTNGSLEHQFLYMPVTNPITGRTWLNNNLGAEYADTNNPNGNFNLSQQATASTDPLAYGSLFQWGRKADGHELINWTDGSTGTGKYNTTSTLANDPANSLFITVSGSPYDWRVDQDNTLWAAESSTNNVCPVGYRLPLNPNDADNEFYVETQTWDSQDAAGGLGSDLALLMPGLRYYSTGSVRSEGASGYYWSGSVTGTYARSMFLYTSEVNPNDSSLRAHGFSVRCLKD